MKAQMTSKERFLKEQIKELYDMLKKEVNRIISRLYIWNKK